MKTNKQINWWKVATIVLAIMLCMLLMHKYEQSRTVVIDGVEFKKSTLISMMEIAIQNDWNEIAFVNPEKNISTILEFNYD